MITDEQRANIQLVHGRGRVEMSQCDLCGHLEFRSINPSCEDEVVVRQLDVIIDPSCGVCQEAIRRSPEVCRWIAKVVRYQIDKAKREDESK